MEGDSSNVFLEIPQGKLMGKKFKDWKDNEYQGFLSIPYAKPPVGELRLKAPVEAGPWNGTLDATKDLPTCMQRNAFNRKIHGTEDCLYLNVYSANVTSSSKLPVLVYIHGGGFFEGCGHKKSFGPDYFIAEGLVIVSLNYRLSTLGSLSTNDQSILPGNFGLKDQVMGLKWVQKNIANFGGDPTNVTIMGQSAGAASVHLHMLSSMSKGLFHKVIMQSGSIHAIWAKGMKGSAKQAAEKLGIPTDNETEMVKQLMKTPAEDLVNTVLGGMLLTLEDINDCAPIVENHKESPNFLPSKPIDILQSGQYSKVPMLIGCNNEEGMFFEILKHIMKSPTYVFDVFNLKKGVPKDLLLGSLPVVIEDVAKRLKDFYFNGKTPVESPQTAVVRIKLLSDLDFRFPVYKAVEDHIKTSDKPIYYYEFGMETNLNSVKNVIPQFKAIKGVAHADELNYFFKKPNINVESNSIEEKCIEKMVKLWANFVKTGNPTPVKDPLLNVEWLPVTEDNMHYLKIENDSLKMQENEHTDNMKFWKDLYEIYGKVPEARL